MPQIPEANEPKAWHQYFAMQANNRAWDLAIVERSESENEEMLDAAHTAAFHWNIIGTDLHKMRAKMLLAEVHALLNLTNTAVAIADEVKEYFLKQDCPDWELAFVHTIHAHAHCVADNQAIFEQSYQLAKQAIDHIQQDADRDIVMATFKQIHAD